ncbi:MAG: ABC transporter permease, partial [Longimicrobiales bacterium]
MNVDSGTIPAAHERRGLLAPGRFGTILLAESRSELLKAMRLPAFLVPMLVFPAMFYALFG